MEMQVKWYRFSLVGVHAANSCDYVVSEVKRNITVYVRNKIFDHKNLVKKCKYVSLIMCTVQASRPGPQSIVVSLI